MDKRGAISFILDDPFINNLYCSRNIELNYLPENVFRVEKRFG